jgi:acetyl esterase/lipase
VPLPGPPSHAPPAFVLGGEDDKVWSSSDLVGEDDKMVMADMALLRLEKRGVGCNMHEYCTTPFGDHLYAAEGE